MITMPTWTRFVLDNPPPTPEGFRDLYTDALAARAFQPHASATNMETAVGWCHADDLLATTFTNSEDWLFNQYAVVGLRMDRKRVSASMRKARLAERCRAWCAENKREKCPAPVKRELREALDLEMLREVVPSPRVVPVAWHVGEGWVLLGSHAVGDIAAFQRLFAATFGVRVVERSPVTGLGDATLVEAFDRQSPAGTAAEFLAWLWGRAGMGHGTLERGEDVASVEWWIDDRVGLSSETEERPTTTIRGDRAATSATLLGALGEHERMRTARVGLRGQDREYHANLVGPLLQVAGAKLPMAVKGDRVEVLFDRMFVTEELHAVLDALFAEYATVRASDRWGQFAGSLGTWLGASVAEKFQVSADGQVLLFAPAAEDPPAKRKGGKRG